MVVQSDLCVKGEGNGEAGTRRDSQRPKKHLAFCIILLGIRALQVNDQGILDYFGKSINLRKKKRADPGVVTKSKNIKCNSRPNTDHVIKNRQVARVWFFTCSFFSLENSTQHFLGHL